MSTQEVYDGCNTIHHDQRSAAHNAGSFSSLLYSIAQTFNDAGAADQETAVLSALGSAAEYFRAETALVFICDYDKETFSVIGAWPEFHAQRHMQYQITFAEMPAGLISQLRRGEVSLSLFHRGDMRSAGALTIPMMAGGDVIGACCYSGIPGGKRRRESILNDLKLFGALLGGFLLRVRSEQSLAETRESAELLLNSTYDGICMVDCEGMILNINNQLASRFGRKPDELTGRSIAELIPESQYGDLFSRRHAFVKDVFQTKQPAFVEDSRDGRWFDNRFYPVIKNGKAVAVTLFSTDITDKKQWEEEKETRMAFQIQEAELKKREQEYLEILDSTTEGSFVADFENGTTRYSENWMKRLNLIGLSPANLLEHFFGEMDPHDVAAIKAHHCRAEALRVPRFRREYRVSDKNDNPIWVMIQGKIIYNDDGRLIKAYGTFIDITERKEMEIELRRQAEELTEQNRLINSFFINVSHEFRTPLSVLLMQLDMMDIHLDEARCEFSGDIKKSNGEMRNSVYRLMHLVGNILDITKAEAGYDRPVLTETDVVALTQQITDAVCAQMGSYGPEISFWSDTRSIIMPTDTTKLEKILLNLLSNAVKHSPADGRIQVMLMSAASSVLISVSDEGDGIPADMLGTVFNRFQRSESLARMHEGCGIGLSLTKALVELLGGRICAESRLGHGSRFFVELPSTLQCTPAQHISQNSLTLAERVQVAFSDVRLNISQQMKR